MGGGGILISSWIFCDPDRHRLLTAQGDEGAADAVGDWVAEGAAHFGGDARPGEDAEVHQPIALGAGAGERGDDGGLADVQIGEGSCRRGKFSHT